MSAEAVEADVAASIGRGWFESVGGFTADLGGVALPLQLEGRRFAILVAGPVGRVAGRYPALAATVRASIERHAGAGAR